MKSMTGFAKKQCDTNGKRITIEIKTLNSKTLDITMKAPSLYRAKELEMRSMLASLERGKIDVYISEESDATSLGQMNADLLTQRYNNVRAVAEQLGCSSEHLFDTLIAQPEIWNSATEDDITDADWQVVAHTFAAAIEEVDAFRRHEGEVLAMDFVRHIDLIEQKLLSIPQYEDGRIETAKERIRRYLAESAIKDVDQNRFEQELIYYLEKLDITEEKIRLAKHIDYFRKTMDTEEVCGKKLGFIVQEMGREINTTGSKANHVEIQKLVVEMKDELEKIKEQLGNIL